ncbi:MAG: DNA mismatch repair endonuclease MutL [bacterium]|nr:DNA mismatch repair endonuclease MutL [bacterium]
MAKIRILPETVASRIAAGEVVERPASVLKELVENALDAGATKIEILIKNAGKSLIQVIDNGCGMSKEDLFLAFERYATSKIERFEDLEDLSTFGFRGEALPSIASVSKVEVKTRVQENDIGWFVALEGGKIVRVEQVVAPIGSNFSVKNLFFNVPARRRFLKTNATENGHLINRFKKFALGNPHIDFSFTVDDDTLYFLKSGTLEERVIQLYSPKILNDLIPIEYRSDFLSIYGYLGNENLFRFQRGEQHLFLNQRVIRSSLITSAVISGLGQIIEQGKYPFYILFMELSPKHFDVNVHPSKEEVKLDDEALVRKIVSDAIRESIRSGGIEKPFHPISTETKNPTFIPTHSSHSDLSVQKNVTDELPILQKPHGYIPPKYRPTDEEFDLHQKILFPLSFTESNTEKIDFESTKRIIQTIELEQTTFWQVQGKYIFVAIPSGIAIVDQHVAHERILYERALRSLQETAGEFQILLFPLRFQARVEDILTAQELKEELKKIGFLIEIPDNQTIEIQGVPRGVQLENEEQTFLEILDRYRNDSNVRTDQEDRLAATFACKAAIKAGTPLNQLEMKQLMRDLLQCEMPYICPHGRPIIIHLSMDELDRRFGRSGG